MIEKIQGKILDGRWKFVKIDRKKSSYVFENIYNHSTINLSHKQVNKVLEGSDTFAHIQTRRIKSPRKTNSPYKGCNGVVKSYARIIRRRTGTNESINDWTKS